MQKREFLRAGAALGAVSALSMLAGCASTATRKAHVVVVGGGYGGATAAKYIRMFSGQQVQVTLVEPQAAFVSCPLSNLVIGGSKTLADLTTRYDALQKKHGVRVVRAMVQSVDADKRSVRLDNGSELRYDKLVLSPGVEMMWGQVEGLQQASHDQRIVQAWKAGPETDVLRRQLESMRDGGVFAITIPEAPYRCPPGPYERASQVAHYFKQHKPRSKVVILDANQDVTSKGPLFKKFWADNYKGIIEYRPEHKTVGVDARTLTARFEVHSDFKADVLNVLPPMRAGAIAVQSKLANANGRWCQVHYQSFESTAAKDVYVLGDAIQIAPGMPKSGHMANAHAKAAAAAIVSQLADQAIPAAPMLTNTCYSYVDDKRVIHVASVHQYDDKDKTFKTVPGSGGVSIEATALEGVYAWNWARNIWADSLL